MYLYVNGELDNSKTLSTVSTPSTSINIGRCASQNYYFDGLIDEFAIWNRVLSVTEVQQLYRRGANRIKYQVRGCGGSWYGPDGTNQTYFSELYNTSDNTLTGAVLAGLPFLTSANFPGAITSPLLPTRYLQYRAILESDDTSGLCSYDGGSGLSCSPELQSVTVGP